MRSMLFNEFLCCSAFPLINVIQRRMPANINSASFAPSSSAMRANLLDIPPVNLKGKKYWIGQWIAYPMICWN